MRQYGWDPDLYNDKHNFVTNYGESLIPLLAPKANETILDLGCGTGKLTAEIAKKASKVIGIDSSNTMIEAATRDYPCLDFQLADGHNFDLGIKFDAVFSNAALHWMHEPQKVIQSVYVALKPGGRFVLEMGGKGNINTIINSIDMASKELGLTVKARANFFPSISEYTALLENNGFVVNFAILYPRPTPLEGKDGLRDWIKMFRNEVLESLSIQNQQRLLGLVEELARPSLFKDNQWVADYVRLRITANKPI